MMQSGESNRRRRRWKSQEAAYDDGRMVGFLAACELVSMLRDPGPFIAEIEKVSKGFAAAIEQVMLDVDNSNSERGA